MTTVAEGFLPHPAGVGSYHLLTRLAVEGLAEFCHVGNHIVDAEYRHGMRIRGYNQTGDLRTDIRAPGIGVREKESLAIGPAIFPFVVQRLALLLQRVLQSG